MKFTISRESLLRPLQFVAGVVEKRHTLAVLSNILLELEEQELTLTSTDLEVELVARVNVEETEAEGRITVPGKKLLDICRSLPDGSLIEIAVDEQKVKITSGRSRFTLSSLPATDFPNTEELVEPKTFSLNQTDLRKAIDSTAFAMAQQDVRYYLNGMLFEVDSKSLRTVSTDGHRLATFVTAISGLDQSQQIIVPRKGVLELAQLLTDAEATVTLELGGNHIRAHLDNFTFTSKLVDGKFPDYTRVIPRNGENVVLADRAELRQVFSRIAILSNEKYRGVRLLLENNTLKAVANNPEQEEAEEVVSVEYNGAPLEMGFNISYLQDVLGVLNSHLVKIILSDANSSALLEESESSDARYVVMPMRL